MSLNPAQQDVLDHLGAARAERPTFDDELRHQVRAELEARLADYLDRLDEADLPVVVSKHRLGLLDGCEARYLAEESQPFAWTVATARGAVAHKAIELSVHWRRELLPLELVDEALARLEEGDGTFAHWLQGCSEAERAELRAEANDRTAKFLECWPRLKPAWRPVTESRLRVELCDQRLVLQGKVDLALGAADGTTAGKVLVDLKTGSTQPAHLHDLRFYALIETLRLGVPPRRIATYYLDQGRFLPEDVTEALLRAAAVRLVAGVERIVELAVEPSTARLRPGPACRWCPALDGCATGRAHLAELDDEPYEPGDD